MNATRTDTDALEPGDTFAERYLLEELIGRGGHSRVYRARQKEFGREVAVKILDGSVAADPRALETFEKRFYREARLLARLSGANTIRVYDYGRSETGQLFMVSELVTGTDLAELLRERGALSPRRARKIFVQILKGLFEVHTEGFLHRDVKPSNVMVYDHLGERDHVKLLDFGIAKGLTPIPDETSLTNAGFVIGTPGYMSPEQAQGAPVTPASDLFSAGLVAYQMLTGNAPYLGMSLEQMHRSMRAGPIRLPGTLEVDPAFAEVVHRCLEVDPSRRYDGTLAALRDLGELNDTVEVPRVEPPMPTNVLTFPLHADLTGTTEFDTLTDAETGMTTQIALPSLVDSSDDPTPVMNPVRALAPAETTRSTPLPEKTADGPKLWIGVVVFIFVLLLGAVIVSNLTGDPPVEDVPEPTPGPAAPATNEAIGVAKESLERATRNAKLDAEIAAKEATLRATPEPKGEPPEAMEFDEEVTTPASERNLAPKPAPKPKRGPKPKPRSSEGTDVRKSAEEPAESSFEVEMIDEL